MSTRELSSALRTHCCVRFCYFGSAELSRPSWLSSSFFAFELRLRRFEGARFTIWHSGPPVCLWVFFKLLPLWHNWRRPSGLRRVRGAGFFRSGQRHLPSWQALPNLSIPLLDEDNVEDVDSRTCMSQWVACGEECPDVMGQVTDFTWHYIQLTSPLDN